MWPAEQVVIRWLMSKGAAFAYFASFSNAGNFLVAQRRREKDMASGHMQVHIDLINVPSSVAYWRKALDVPETDLPALTAEQKRTARSFGISEREYAQTVLARQYSEARYRRYAEHFGNLLVKAARSRSVESAEVTYDGWENKFHCWLEAKGTTVPIIFDAELIIAPLERGDSRGLVEAEKRLKQAVEWALQPVAKAGHRPVNKNA